LRPCAGIELEAGPQPAPVPGGADSGPLRGSRGTAGVVLVVGSRGPLRGPLG